MEKKHLSALRWDCARAGGSMEGNRLLAYLALTCRATFYSAPAGMGRGWGEHFWVGVAGVGKNNGKSNFLSGIQIAVGLLCPVLIGARPDGGRPGSSQGRSSLP